MDAVNESTAFETYFNDAKLKMKEHIAKEKAKYDKKCKREKAVEEKRQLTLLY